MRRQGATGVGSGVGLPPGLSVGVGFGSDVGGGAVGGSEVGAAVGAGVGASVAFGGAEQKSRGSFVFVGSFDGSGIVSSPVGSVPAGGNARAARSEMRFIRGISTEPRGSFCAPWTS